MVQHAVPSPLAKSELAYEESLKETEEALPNTSLLQLSPAPSLNLTRQLHSVVASLSSNLCFLYSMFVASIAKRDRFQLWSFQLTRAQLCRQKSSSMSFQLTTAQLCSSAAKSFESLQQKELAAAYAFMAQFQDSPTRARQFQLTNEQLCFDNQHLGSGSRSKNSRMQDEQLFRRQLEQLFRSGALQVNTGFSGQQLSSTLVSAASAIASNLQQRVLRTSFSGPELPTAFTGPHLQPSQRSTTEKLPHQRVGGQPSPASFKKKGSDELEETNNFSNGSRACRGSYIATSLGINFRSFNED